MSKNGQNAPFAKNPAEAKKAITPLLKEYDTVDAGVSKARKALDDAMNARSAIVEEIADVIGKKQPIRYGGRLLRIMSRTAKDEKGNPVGDTTWYFRAEGDVEALDM